MGTSESLGKTNKLRGVTCYGLASHPGGVEMLLAASCYRNQDKLRQLWVSTCSKASLFFLFIRWSLTGGWKQKKYKYFTTLLETWDVIGESYNNNKAARKKMKTAFAFIQIPSKRLKKDARTQVNIIIIIRIIIYLFTYNAQVSIYIFTCAELNSLKIKTNYKYMI